MKEKVNFVLNNKNESLEGKIRKLKEEVKIFYCALF